ncbi:MAG: hypothetical protein COY66_06880 [Candidatus Kerfeldbacteria bacterium CG_4_10_14_0_8_um_filter_42_10]|uniref:Uncharacterized protein n=1 Tax=Candidatus Kerfeldbacteria bacterium CG_4_10_14_0_8_um_filter_42_10 TaxID=2014248 RepID=A0A2M7RFX4_9BACT|nr:MAG: hypothetical protein COY66_06880 [Candidatus Kerfeldbacteria bacterium CG_4_10_14_0_8_um_filter_42_10]
MKIGKILVGLILIALAVWIYFAIENSTAKYLGGAVLVIAGLIMLATGFKKEGGPKSPPQSPTPPPPPSPENPQ